jgi:predicted acylesterase/phospholipase RssA
MTTPATTASASASVGRLLDLVGRALFDDTRFVVFGGGAMLGAMFIGVLQALCGLDRDRYARWAGRLRGAAGTSAGAILAFLVVAGVDPWDMKALMDRHDVGAVLGDIKTPQLQEVIARGSLSSGAALDALLQGLVGDVLGDGGDPGALTLGAWAKPELVITVTNAVTGIAEFWSAATQPDVPVWVALRASASVPGLFPVVHWRGTPYHDGGVTCNLPCHLFDPRLTLTLMVHVGPAPGCAPVSASASASAPASASLDPATLVQHLAATATTTLRIVQWYMCAAQLGPMRSVPALTLRCVPCMPLQSAALLGRSGAFAFDAVSSAGDTLLADGAACVRGAVARIVCIGTLVFLLCQRHAPVRPPRTVTDTGGTQGVNPCWSPPTWGRTGRASSPPASSWPS